MKPPIAKLRYVFYIFSVVQLLFFSHPVWAVFKCTSTSGKITYQDEPCNDKTSKKMEHVGYKSSRPLMSRVDAVCKLRRGFNGYLECLRVAYANFNVTYDVPASKAIIDEYLRYIYELESQMNKGMIDDAGANYRLASRRDEVTNKMAPIVAQHMHEETERIKKQQEESRQAVAVAVKRLNDLEEQRRQAIIQEAKERSEQESRHRQAAALDAIVEAQRRQAAALEKQAIIEQSRPLHNRQTHCTSYVFGKVINTSCY